MSLNETPAANRTHIAFFGRRNAGKSSLVNAVTNQKLSIVSDEKGTTTDPVYKSMELLPLGPVLIIDTPGLDDVGELGELRIEKAMQVLEKTDIAVLVVDASCEDDGDIAEKDDRKVIEQFEKRDIPYIIVYNKCDLVSDGKMQGSRMLKADNIIHLSSVTGEGINEFKEKLANLMKGREPEKRIVADLLNPLDVVVLVVPIDASAPKGRLILPQQQVVRDILDAGGVSVVVKDTELEETFNKLAEKPKMVITDSQAFKKVSEITPKDVSLTSFSILMARWKGFLKTAVAGADALSDIKDGDEILIAEGCTHHRQCEDIGTVKLPNLIRKYTGASPVFTFTSGGDFPKDLSKYKVIIQCGGCMLNEKAVRYRMREAVSQGIPFTNYGTAIAKMNGILERSVEIVSDEIYD